MFAESKYYKKNDTGFSNFPMGQRTFDFRNCKNPTFFNFFVEYRNYFCKII